MGFPSRLPPETQLIAEGSFDKNPNHSACHYLDKLDGIENACLLGDKQNKTPSVALIGNSHADHLALSLDMKLSALGKTAYNFAFNGCNPVDFKNDSANYTLNNCFEQIKGILKSNKDVDTLIVSFRWTSLLTGVGFGDENLDEKETLAGDTLKTRGEVVVNKISELIGDDKDIILVYPVPEAGKDVPNYTVKYRMLFDDDYVLKTPYNLFVSRNTSSIQALDKLSSINKIERIYPSAIFCEQSLLGNRLTVLNGKSLYFDDDHLSNFGASLVVNQINLVSSEK